MMDVMSRVPALVPGHRWRPDWAAARLACSGVMSLLALFHVWVFAGQIGRGDLWDLSLAFRWMVAAGLLAVLVWLRRRGESLVGREAIAVWVLAALLHGPALTGDRFGPLDSPAIPEAITGLLQMAASFAGLGLALIGALALRRRPQVPALARASHPRVSLRIADRSSGLSFAPRPPPRA